MNTDMKINNDQVSSMVGIIIGVLIVIHSLNYEIGSLSSPSVGFFPLIEGLAILLLSLFGLVHASFQSLKGVGWNPIIKGAMWRRPLLAFISLLIYGLVVKYLGFIVTTVFFMAFILRVLERQRWSVVIITSILSALASYGIFEICLKSQLPSGLFGF